MKRDLDIIRYICTNIEESTSLYITNVDPENKYGKEIINY